MKCMPLLGDRLLESFTFYAWEEESNMCYGQISIEIDGYLAPFRNAPIIKASTSHAINNKIDLLSY